MEGRAPVAALVGRLAGVLSEIRSGDAGAPVAASVGGPAGAAARSGREAAGRQALLPSGGLAGRRRSSYAGRVGAPAQINKLTPATNINSRKHSTFQRF